MQRTPCTRGGHAFSLAEGDEMIETINRSDATRERKSSLLQICLQGCFGLGHDESRIEFLQCTA